MGYLDPSIEGDRRDVWDRFGGDLSGWESVTFPEVVQIGRGCSGRDFKVMGLDRAL